MPRMGKLFIVVGAVFVVIGLVLTFVSPFSSLKIGRLPGDIYIKKDNFTFYFPLTTSILLSVLLTLVLSLLSRK
jgi:ABC-type sugar transport system permease subunit